WADLISSSHKNSSGKASIGALVLPVWYAILQISQKLLVQHFQKNRFFSHYNSRNFYWRNIFQNFHNDFFYGNVFAFIFFAVGLFFWIKSPFFIVKILPA